VYYLANLCADQDILKDMMNLVTSEVDLSEQAAFKTKVNNTIKEVNIRSGNDFESSALALVQLRNSRFQHISHFVALS
jgi:hypothetical protein